MLKPDGQFLTLAAPVKKQQGQILDQSDYAVASEVGKKYEHLYDPSVLYLNVNSAVGILGQIFSAVEFSGLGYQTNTANDQKNYKELFRQSEAAMVEKPSPYLRMEKEYVEVGINLPSLTFTLYHTPNAKDSSSLAAVDKAVRIVQAYWPKYKMPDSWKLETDDETRVTKRMPVGSETEFEASYTLEQLTRIRPSYTPPKFGERGPSLYPEVTHNYEPFAGMGFIKMTLVPEVVRGSSWDNPRKGDIESGNIAGSDFGIVYNVKLTGIIRFPMEYCLWATTVHNPSEFIPLSFWNLISARHAYYNHPKKGRRGSLDQPPETIATLASTYREYRGLIEVEKKKPTPKVNEDDLMILMDGRVVWIPTVDRVVEYQDQLKSAHDSTNNEIIPSAKVKDLPDRPVFTDWITDKFLWTNQIGRLEALDLIGGRPLDSVTIWRYLRTNVDTDTGTRLAQILHSAAETYKLYDKVAPVPKGASEYDTTVRTMRNANLMMKQILSCPHKITWAELGGQTFGAENEYVLYKKYCAIFSALVKECMRYFDKLDKSVSEGDKINWLRLYMVLISKYSQPEPYKAYHDAFAGAVAVNSATPQVEQDPRIPIKVYNMPHLAALMPHQVEVEAIMRSAPKGIIMDISPGGGKTTLYLIAATRLLGEGKVKRPLIITKSRLVSEFVKTANNWSGGKLNVFPITRLIWKRWTENLGLTEAQIVEMIKRQPINTIFITDYNFLSLGKADYQYENFWFTYMPMALMMSDIGFDFSGPDESHTVKNEESNRSQATAIVAARTSLLGGYIYPASGTIIFNVASDLVGQTNLINPSVFYNRERFNEMYTSDEKGTIVSDASRAEIYRALQPYARRIKVGRSAWAHLLPPSTEKFFAAQLTPKQQEFYDKRLEEIIEDIQNDPKLMKLLQSGDPAVQEKIEEALKRYFVKLEIFINAPDSDQADKQLGIVFREMEGIKPIDLVSPKVAVIDSRIDLHFKGGYDDDGTGNKVKVAPSPHKVLIVGFNKAVSEHLYRHTKWNKEFLWYRAGDMDTFNEARYNPKIKGLFADENSIKEGFDMQMFDKIIRVQSPWTPGELDQLYSRVGRPDVPDKDGKVKYDREKIESDWILMDNTLEIAKTARLISKLIQKAKMDEGDTASFMGMYKINEFAFERVSTISMNLDSIKEYSKMKDLTEAFTAYSILKGWEDMEYAASKRKLKERLEKIYGRMIRDEEVAALAMHKVDGSYVIPNSSELPSYQPWIENAPPVDHHGLNLVPLSDLEIDPESEEDMGDTDEDTSITEGMLVMTEFGPGRIAKLRKNSNVVYVHVPGLFKGAVRMPKQIVYKPTNEKATAAFTQKLKLAGNSGLPTLRLDSGRLINTPQMLDIDTKSLVQDGKVPEEKPKGKVWPVEMNAAVVNTQLALYTTSYNEKYASRLINRGWSTAGTVIGAQVKTWKALSLFLQYLREKYTVPSDHQEEIKQFIEMMKSKKGNLGKIRSKDIKFIRNFFINERRKSKDKMRVDPYLIVVNGAVFIIFDISVHPIARRLMAMTKIPNLGKFEEWGELMVKFFVGKSALTKEIEAFEDLDIKVTNEEDLQSEIKKLK